MKKCVNARLPLILSIALIAGILLGYLFIRIRINLLFIIASLPAAAVIFIFCIIYSRKQLLIFSLTAILFLTVGTVYVYLKLDGYGDKELVDGDIYTISATVCEKGEYDGGEYLLLKNATCDGTKIGGKIKAYLSAHYGEFCDVGYKVNFKAEISTYDTFPYGKLNYNAQNNVKYYCNVYSGLSSTYRFSLFGSVNKAIRSVLYNNTDADTAAIAYAMLTGNTDGIEDGSLSAFRYGGVAHVFAVSGLHIGLIYGLLRFLCKKLRLNGIWGFVVCILPLFLYAGVCGFTPSSVRALIMCSVAAAARIAYAKYDALNSLALSVTVILLINPLYLFGVGFPLSVCAVCSIILFAKNIARPLKRIPHRISSSVGVSVAAQAGTAPIMLARFGYLSGAGVFLNIILIPVLSVFYAIVFVATVLSLILPFAASFILPYAVVPLQLIISLITAAGFEKSLISGFGAGAFIVIYFFLLLSCSDKFNVKIKYRLISVICALAVLCTYVPVKTFAPLNGYKVIASANFGGGQVLFKHDGGSVLVITQNLNVSRVDELLNQYYSSKVDAIIILGGENCVSVYGKLDLNCDAYVFNEYLNIQPFANKSVKYEKEFEICGINFEFFDGYSLLAVCGDTSVGICAGKYTPIKYCNLLITDNFDYHKADTMVSFNERSFESCIYDDGNFEYKING